jgi:hypothetical protein
MFRLEKTRAAEYADLSSDDKLGFGSLAGPIACLDQYAAEAEARLAAAEAEGGLPSFAVDIAVGG